MAKSKRVAAAHFEFNDAPEPTDVEERWQIVRVGVKGMRQAIVLSERVTGHYLHYASSRSMPCRKRACPLCDLGEQRRWYGYLPISGPDGQKRALLEITPNAFPAIQHYLRTHTTLRGAELELWRCPAKRNGHLHCKCRESRVLVDGLPPSPNVAKILQRIWRLNVSFDPTREAEQPLRIATAEQDVG